MTMYYKKKLICSALFLTTAIYMDILLPKINIMDELELMQVLRNLTLIIVKSLNRWWRWHLELRLTVMMNSILSQLKDNSHLVNGL